MGVKKIKRYIPLVMATGSQRGNGSDVACACAQPRSPAPMMPRLYCK